jgi:hypothetical protein
LGREGDKVMVDLNRYVTRSDKFNWRMIDDQVFLINDEENKMHLLNKVGSLIWQSATGGLTIHDIVARIMERFDVDEGNAQKDAIEFIERLANMEILSLGAKPI